MANGKVLKTPSHLGAILTPGDVGMSPNGKDYNILLIFGLQVNIDKPIAYRGPVPQPLISVLPVFL